MDKAQTTEFCGPALSSSLTSVHFIPELIACLLRLSAYALQWQGRGCV